MRCWRAALQQVQWRRLNWQLPRRDLSNWRLKRRTARSGSGRSNPQLRELIRPLQHASAESPRSAGGKPRAASFNNELVECDADPLFAAPDRVAAAHEVIG